MEHINDFTDYILENLDKTETENIKQHLDSCSSCFSRYSHQMQFYKFLTDNYEKVEDSLCPSEDFMEDYIIGEFDKESKRLFLYHLDNCEKCREQLEMVKASTFDHQEALNQELPQYISDIINPEKSFNQELEEALFFLKNKTRTNFDKVVSVLSDMQNSMEPEPVCHGYNNFEYKSSASEIDIKIPEEYEESLRNISIKIDESRLSIDEMDSGNIDISVEKDGKPVKDVEIQVKSKWESESLLKTDNNGKIRIKKISNY